MGVPEEYQYDFWLKEPVSEISLTCLMPNGLIIILSAHINDTFAEIKEDLWYEAHKLPLYGMLHDMSVYVFTFVNIMSELEEINDETRRLGEIRPQGGVLKITECIGDKTENNLNMKIGHLIGKRLPEFDSLSSAEINDFRFKMRKLGDEIAQHRTKQTWQERLLYQCPPRISPDDNCLSTVNNQVYQNGNLFFSTTIEGNSNSMSFSKFSVKATAEPGKLLEMILTKKATVLNTRLERPENYILKACGIDEYLIGDHPIIHFEYIRDCIFRDALPMLIPVLKQNVPMQLENDYGYLSVTTHKKQHSTLTLRKKGNQQSSWNLTDKFSITLCTVSKLNCDIKKSAVEIGVQVGLFHGGKSLCEPQKTTERTVTENLECAISEKLVFDIQICNVPRSAKLCFSIYEATKSGKGARSKKFKELTNKDLLLNPIAWANTTVFDFKNQLKTGAMTLYMWTYAEDMLMMNDDLLHPLGTVVSNPNTKYATALTLTFDSYDDKELILFPSVEYILNYVHEKHSREPECETLQKSTKELAEYKKIFIENENIYEVHDQDRKELWMHRKYWQRTAPEVLPKLLDCIDWDNRDDVSEIVFLLEDWPVLPVEKALELLDYAYADQQVRRFAVKCLKPVENDDLLLYLLQLVQAIKHEIFLDCDLVKYLLERALYNQKIGHFLFWHLRSEMQVASVSVRFGLILEAYCRGSQEHMTVLSKQLDCLEKFKKCSELVRSCKDKEKARYVLQEYLGEAHCTETVRNLSSPLDPSYRCNKVKLDKIKVMDSKMRPLWVVYENSDLNGDDIYVIFKNGDDLRQDMLTLQMLRIMDKLWKQEGLDLRMNPYKCISMEYRIGMIEVVLDAETIANIQKERGMFSATSAFRKGSILAWLKLHNKSEVALKNAISEFTLSCAGYCVATYVLGVADRHSDNIMVKKNGQLFHIDFGHILGHFKEKFGFKRERVPFVLTHDFVHVISKGEKKNLEFKTFQHYCEQAFLILRKHGGLILSLFAMMISTGLPELSSEKDLNYLKETLVLSKTEPEALEHFRSKFDEALCNSWKTSMNWATHNIAKNNKTN